LQMAFAAQNFTVKRGSEQGSIPDFTALNMFRKLKR
jgi:hypothetical protein